MGAATAALKEVGYATSQSDEHPERDVEFFQFLLRDTGARVCGFNFTCLDRAIMSGGLD